MGFQYFLPVTYTLRTLNEAEQRYSATKNEVLVVVWAFDKLKLYVMVIPLVVGMNHLALKAIDGTRYNA